MNVNDDDVDLRSREAQVAHDRAPIGRRVDLSQGQRTHFHPPTSTGSAAVTDSSTPGNASQTPWPLLSFVAFAGEWQSGPAQTPSHASTLRQLTAVRLGDWRRPPLTSHSRRSPMALMGPDGQHGGVSAVHHGRCCSMASAYAPTCARAGRTLQQLPRRLEASSRAHDGADAVCQQPVHREQAFI